MNRALPFRGAPSIPRRVPLWFPPVVFVGAALIASVVHAVVGRLFSVPLAQADHTWWLNIVSVVALWAGLISSVVWARHLYGPLFERDFFTVRWWRTQRSDLLYLVVGVLIQIVVGLVYLPFHAKSVGNPTRELLGTAHGWQILLICLTASVGAPIVEEIFFRGLLLGSLQSVPAAWFAQRFRGALPIVVSGLLFAAAHAQGVQFAGLAIAGVSLAVIRRAEGRIAPSIFAHAGFNAIALIVTLHAWLVP